MTSSNEGAPSAGGSSARLVPKPRRLSWWFAQLRGPLLFLAAGVLVIVLLGVAQRIGWITRGGAARENAGAASAAQVYTCPMHPQIRQPRPGSCSICGMDLVPATAGQATIDLEGVQIEPAQRRLANIQVAPANEREVTTTIRTVGALQIDESRQATISSYIDGRVERMFADYTGVTVAEGDHLAVIYSPQLYSAQVEYLEARRAVARGQATVLPAVREAQAKLLDNARQRLVELGMTAEQLRDLETTDRAKSRLTVFSPIGGTVIEKFVEEGKYLSAGEPLYRIANLATIWLMLELYPEDASQIRFGQLVEAELDSLPGVSLQGRVAFIDPQVSPSTRTVGVRVEFRNDQGQLRPGDYAKALIRVPVGPRGDVYDRELAGKWISPMHPQVIQDAPGECPICGMKLVPTARYGYSERPLPQPKSLVVPRSALLTAGPHSVLYVETEPGRFELRNVTVGAILRDEVVILAGILPGEMVAVSGNFLIDSQMQLAGNPSLIDPVRRKPPSGPRNQPLEIAAAPPKPLVGEAGAELEQLYRAYFEIQTSLAADQLPLEPSVVTLNQRAGMLAGNGSLTDEDRQRLAAIRDQSAHLHHLSLDEARVKFKALSEPLIKLAARLRGEGAAADFHHFFCPMVKGGSGDWLQPDTPLANPYYGSQMLRCGELVRTFPASETPHDGAAGSAPPANAPAGSRGGSASATDSQPPELPPGQPPAEPAAPAESGESAGADAGLLKPRALAPPAGKGA